MFEKLIDKNTYTEADIAFVIKNIRKAPKELLIKLGLAKGEVKKEVVAEASVVDEAPKKSRFTKKIK